VATVHRVLAPNNRPLLIAHRVGNKPADVPAAVAAGADLIEADVHLYRRRLEVRHTKTMGVLPWLWDRWYVVPARDERLVLAALLAGIPDDTRLMLDLKGWHPWLGRSIAKAMEAAAPGRRYVVASRQWGMLNAFEKLEHVQIIHSAAGPREALALPRRLSNHRTDAICMHERLLASRRWVKQARRLSQTLLTWPVATTDAARQALDRGADGLIVDGVDLLGELAASRTELWPSA
jgi:glycerophosphoryl diester phosphodiesterase